MTTPKGGATTTTTQRNEVPEYVKNAQTNMLGQAGQVLDPFIQRQAFTQAGINPDQSAAYDLSRSLAQNAFTGGQGTQNALTQAQRAAGGQMPNSPQLMDFRDNAAYWQARPEVQQAQTRDAQHQGYLHGQYAAHGYDGTGYQHGTTAADGYNANTYDGQGYNAQGYDALNYAARGYAGHGYDATGAAATGYNAQGANATGYAAREMGAEQVDGAQIQALLNPYTQSVVDQTTRTMERARDTTAARNNARSAAAGSFGGSRQALQSAELDRSFGDQVASTTATMMQAGYDRATATAMANAQARQAAGSSNQAAINRALEFGAGAQNTVNLANQAASNRAAEFGAGATNTANLANQSATNRAREFGASATNTANQFSAQAQNAAEAQNAQLQTQRNAANAAATDAARAFTSGARNASEAQNAAARNAAAAYTASAHNAARDFNANSYNQAAQFGANAQNTARQFGANATNAANQFNTNSYNQAEQTRVQGANQASLANAGAFNAASQLNATQQNARDTFNAQTGAGLMQNQNANAISRYGQDINAYQARNQQQQAMVTLQEAIRSGDQNRQMQAIQQLMGIGNAQQQQAQTNIQTPLQYLQMLGALTPQQYGSTGTTTAPNTAPSPLQSILGLAGTLGGAFLGRPG